LPDVLANPEVADADDDIPTAVSSASEIAITEPTAENFLNILAFQKKKLLSKPNTRILLTRLRAVIGCRHARDPKLGVDFWRCWC
jgi:hypothetical protein